jgi:hypothetical protein
VVLRSELFFFVRMQLIVMFRQHLIELAAHLWPGITDIDQWMNMNAHAPAATYDRPLHAPLLIYIYPVIWSGRRRPPACAVTR